MTPNFKSSYWIIYLLLVTFLSTMVLSLKAQDLSIGEWKSHLPHQNAKAVCVSDEAIFCVTNVSFFSVDLHDNSITRYGTVSGLSDVGVKNIRYSFEDEMLLIAYENLNVDLMQNGKIINLSDIKRKGIVGEKDINDILFFNHRAYLSASFGIVVLDLEKMEVEDTYTIGAGGGDINVNQVAILGNTIYAATAEGLKSGDLGSPFLANYQNWVLESGNAQLPLGNCTSVSFLGSALFCVVNDTVFKFANNLWEEFYHLPYSEVSNMNLVDSELLVSINVFDPFGNRIDAFISAIQNDGISQMTVTDNLLEQLFQATRDQSGAYWAADLIRGLVKIDHPAGGQSVIPNGPFGKSAWNMSISEGKLLVAPGGVTSSWSITGNTQGFYQLSEDWWTNYNQYSTTWLTGVQDIIAIIRDPATNAVYAGSYWAGMIEWREGEDGMLWNSTNSSLGVVIGDEQRTRVSGLALDNDGNLWVSNNGASETISVKKTDNTWQSFKLPLSFNVTTSGQMLVDDFNQKWMITPTGSGAGIVVFNHGANIEAVADDQYYLYKTGEGLGNLPNNKVHSMAKDREGAIWIGTEEGIAIVHCPGQVFTGGCDAQQILVQQDGFNGFLLANETVTAIAVDAGNRKWVGTANGIWLFSADGTEQLAFFDDQNSPLFSNNILSLAIDHSTGEVYVGTDQGLISFRGEAVEGGEKHQDVYAFPNPVEPGYEGPIAITGLVQDAQVKITDISGTLIYETPALGGQAIWNGKDPNGRRANTGVYLVFSTNDDGSEKFVTKILFIQ